MVNKKTKQENKATGRYAFEPAVAQAGTWMPFGWPRSNEETLVVVVKDKVIVRMALTGASQGHTRTNVHVREVVTAPAETWQIACA